MNAERRELLGVAALLALLTLVVLWPLPIHLDRFVVPSDSEFSDLLITHWPMQALMRESLLSGDGLAFWQPAYLSGEPLAGNPQAGFHYPPNWLQLLIAPPSSFGLLLLAHIWWCALGVYWLLRRGVRTSPAGALGGAVFLAFGSRLAAHMSAGHITIVYALAWLPWAALTALTACSVRGGWKLGILIGLAFLADVKVGFYAGLIVAAILVGRAVRDRSSGLRAWVRRWAGFATSTVVASAGTSAVLLLPFVELLGQSTRSNLTTQDAAALSLPPAALLGTVLPLRPWTHEWAVYVGVPAVILLAASLFSRHRAAVRALWAASSLAVLLALGSYTPLYRLALAVVPGLTWLRVPARFWILAVLGFGLLLGLGVDVLVQMDHAQRRSFAKWAVGLTGVLAAFVGFALAARVGAATRLLPFAIISLASLVALLLFAFRRMPGTGMAALLLVFLLADQVSAARGWWRLMSVGEAIAPGQAVVQRVLALSPSARAYSPSYSIPQQTAWYSDLETVSGVDPMQIRRYREFMALAGGYDDLAYSVTIPAFPGDRPLGSSLAESRPDARLLGMLNVRYLVAEFPLSGDGWKFVESIGEASLYENERVLPRAWLVHQTLAVTEEADALAMLQSYDLSRETVVEKQLPGPLVEPADNDREAVAIVENAPNRVVIETESASAGLLVVSRVWYPGWQASVDGEPAQVLRANYVLQGIYLPGSGVHQVELRYTPVLLCIGAALSGLTLVAYLALKRFGETR